MINVYIKIIGSVFIIYAGFLGGRFLSNEANERLKELRHLKEIFTVLRGKILKEEEAEVSDNLEKVEENNSYNKEYVLDMENKLKTVLENVEGVGQVQVFITLWASKESILCKDSPYEQTTNVNTDNNGVRE